MTMPITTAMVRSSGTLQFGRCLMAASNQHSCRARNKTMDQTDRTMSTTESYKLLILGGGTAGTTMASKFASKLGTGQVAVIEPSKVHYYQPMFTLVGSGLKSLEQTHRPTADVLPKNCDWLQTSVSGISPKDNTVSTTDGRVVKYEYLVIALGMQLNFYMVKGLEEALEHDPSVCSNYSPKFVEKTHRAMKAFDGGTAIFTFPNTPIKCAGAPQKILYLVEDYLRRNGKRDNATLIYTTPLGVVFGVPKYAQALHDQMLERDIKLTLMRDLVEVKYKTKEAVFKVMGKDDVTETYKYDMLHVAPPCSSPKVLWDSEVSDKAGYVDVNKQTCQHVRYPNIFALGDCANLPTSKTAAAISGQCGVLTKNLTEVMAGQIPSQVYDGYTSCPLLTKKGRCIMAEFGYDGKVLETLPVNQANPMRFTYFLKVHCMPTLYWMMLLKGYWDGPKQLRRMFHLWLRN